MNATLFQPGLIFGRNQRVLSRPTTLLSDMPKRASCLLLSSVKIYTVQAVCLSTRSWSKAGEIWDPYSETKLHAQPTAHTACASLFTFSCTEQSKLLATCQQQKTWPQVNFFCQGVWIMWSFRGAIPDCGQFLGGAGEAQASNSKATVISVKSLHSENQLISIDLLAMWTRDPTPRGLPVLRIDLQTNVHSTFFWGHNIQCIQFYLNRILDNRNPVTWLWWWQLKGTKTRRTWNTNCKHFTLCGKTFWKRLSSMLSGNPWLCLCPRRRKWPLAPKRRFGLLPWLNHQTMKCRSLLCCLCSSWMCVLLFGDARCHHWHCKVLVSKKDWNYTQN